MKNKEIIEKVLKEIGKENNLDMITCDCEHQGEDLCVNCCQRKAIEKALSLKDNSPQSSSAGDRRVSPGFDNAVISQGSPADILKKIEEEVARFRNLTLNANVISKNYIEISTFNYRVNLLEEEIKKIFQEELYN